MENFIPHFATKRIPKKFSKKPVLLSEKFYLQFRSILRRGGVGWREWLVVCQLAGWPRPSTIDQSLLRASFPPSTAAVHDECLQELFLASPFPPKILQPIQRSMVYYSASYGKYQANVMLFAMQYKFVDNWKFIISFFNCFDIWMKYE